jgi:hypothetical protein
MESNPYRRSDGGRHRLGTAGLRHCRELVPAPEPMVTGHRRPRATTRVTAGPAVGRAVTAVAARCAALACGALTVGVLAVSGWYTAAGASAVAQMITP